MKLSLVLIGLMVVFGPISTEYIFVPDSPQLRTGKIEIPGLIVDKKDTIVLPEENVKEFSQAAFPDTESRALTPPSPILTFQTNRPVVAAAPMCLACTCLIGKQTCAQAGGVMIYTTNINFGAAGAAAATPTACTPAAPCIIDPPPATLPACDPACRAKSATCSGTAPVTAAAPLSCPTAVVATQCLTDCANRNIGDLVVCNSAAIGNKVMSAVPSTCRNKKKRNVEEQRSERQRRLISLPFPARFFFNPPSPTITVPVPGNAFLPFAPLGACLRDELANAPFCTKDQIPLLP